MSTLTEQVGKLEEENKKLRERNERLCRILGKIRKLADSPCDTAAFHAILNICKGIRQELTMPNETTRTFYALKQAKTGKYRGGSTIGMDEWVVSLADAILLEKRGDFLVWWDDKVVSVVANLKEVGDDVV